MKIEDLVTFEVNGKKCVAFVRKLTERECFRLMGVDEAHIDTIANCGVSRSAQYKMAGNSIVVDVLYHIFRTAFIPSERGAGGDLFGSTGLIHGEFTKDKPLRVATLCSGMIASSWRWSGFIETTQTFATSAFGMPSTTQRAKSQTRNSRR